VSNLSASARRPPFMNSLTIRSSSSIGTGMCGVRGGGGGIVAVIVLTVLFHCVAETLHHRLYDRDHGLKMFQIVAVTKPRPVMEFLLYLRVAGVCASRTLFWKLTQRSSKGSPMKSSMRRAVAAIFSTMLS
jgi:hypothetical protein